MIYMDNAATTQIHPDVLAEMMPYLTDWYGNAGAIYSFGREAQWAVERARERVAEMINASPDQIIFTSGGTEANNMVFAGLFYKWNPGVIWTSKVEHDSVLNTVSCLKKAGLCDVNLINVDQNCVVDIDELGRNISELDDGIVSVMYVNNETGAVNPVNEIGKFCMTTGLLFHSDCVQAAGYHKIDVKEMQCDFLSLSSHKIHGPKGVGALYVRKKSFIHPLIHGGSEQEFGLRGGTENVAGIVGFGKACQLVSQGLNEQVKKIDKIKNKFYNRLVKNLSERGLESLMHVNAPSVGKILSLRFDGIDAETLILMLDVTGVSVSAGSACRSQESEPSHVLLAMGLTPDEARSTIRVSFSSMCEEDDAEMAAKIIADCVQMLAGDRIQR